MSIPTSPPVIFTVHGYKLATNTPFTAEKYDFVASELMRHPEQEPLRDDAGRVIRRQWNAASGVYALVEEVEYLNPAAHPDGLAAAGIFQYFISL